MSALLEPPGAVPSPGTAPGTPLQAEAPVVVNPLTHPAWDSLVASHPQSTVFHTSAWARVLHETYGHQPLYICRFDGPQFELLPIMEVRSRWTGARGVSLPFTDYASPLTSAGRDFALLYEAAVEQGRMRHWKYLECRGDFSTWPGASASLSFYSHDLELICGADGFFANLDGAERSAIRKAERSGISVTFQSNLDAMQSFYELHCLTRRRHCLPPQPFKFFRNIVQLLLEQERGFIALALLKGKAIAAGVFLHSGKHAVYKYGASNFEFQRLRPTNLLLWEVVKCYSGTGMAVLNLGRTPLENEGLRRFKLALGARETRVAYARYNFASSSFVQDVDRSRGWHNVVFRAMPPRVLRFAGLMLYPHLS